MKKLLVMVVLILLIGCSPKDETLSLAAGGLGGTYYPVGAAISEVISENVDGLRINAFSSSASVANANDLNSREVDIAMIQSNVAYWANQGIGLFEGNEMPELRSIGVLYPEIIQVVVRRDSNFDSIYDLRGHNISVGKETSGNRFDAIKILEAYNFTENDYNEINLDFKDSFKALEEREIQAIFITSGIPTNTVLDASNRMEIDILPIDQTVMDELIGSNPYYTLGIITPEDYSNLENEVRTLSTNAMLVTHVDLDDDIVYEITKALWTYQTTLSSVHDSLKNMTIEYGLKGRSIELHPGAKRYYEEVGFTFDN